MSSDKTVLLKISSRDMTIGRSKSTSDFSVSFNNVSKLQNAKGCVIKSVSFMNTMPNIPPHKTQFTFYTSGDAGVGTVESFNITTGQYTVSELYIAVKAQIDAAITPDTCTITQNLDGTTTITTGSTPFSFYANDTNGQNQMAEILGFSYFDNNETASLTHTSTGYPQLSGTSRVYIESNALANSNMVNSKTNTVGNVLVSVPVDVNFLTLEHFFAGERVTNTVLFNKQRNLGNIDICVRDEDNQVVDFKNQHITLVLLVIY